MTSHPMLACGPYFAEGAVAATLAIFLVVKPLAYYAFIQAYRFRVNRHVPMSVRRAIGLAALRAGLGLVLVGGGAALLLYSGLSQAAIVSWSYLYLSRLAAWWIVGKVAALGGYRLVGWVGFGTLINAAFDGAVVAGLVTGPLGAAIVVAVIFAFILILHRVGRRASLQARFGEPMCRVCLYNLTGNLSGICPECGTPIVARRAGSGLKTSCRTS